jgi:hypothetical protein
MLSGLLRFMFLHLPFHFFNAHSSIQGNSNPCSPVTVPPSRGVYLPLDLCIPSGNVFISYTSFFFSLLVFVPKQKYSLASFCSLVILVFAASEGSCQTATTGTVAFYFDSACTRVQYHLDNHIDATSGCYFSTSSYDIFNVIYVFRLIWTHSWYYSCYFHSLQV